jgi:uncharacterized membrane protein YdfJ with MMPL/SSD domain
LNTHSNIAARVGRWSVQHRKKAIIGWLVFVIVAVMGGNMAGVKLADDNQGGPGESGRAAAMLQDADWGGTRDGEDEFTERVLIQSKTLKAQDPKFQAGVEDVITRLDKTKGVSEVQSPYAPQNADKITADGHSALVEFTIPGDSDAAELVVARTITTVDAAAEAHPAVFIGEQGDLSIDKAIADKDAEDLHKAESTSLPITLVILLLSFGALVAAGVPLLLGLTSVGATMGLLGPISHLVPLGGAYGAVVMLIGLAVGVDYALFYLRRAREERAAGKDTNAAIEAAAATSGRAVLISGMTVMIAMGGMYFSGASTFTSFATATIVVVAVAVIGSLTVLPAVLSKLGDRVDKGRIPFVGRLKSRASNVGLWSRIVDKVMRRPLVAILISGGLLIGLTIPALGMHTELPGVESYSRDLAVVQTYDKIQAAFPAENMPSMVVIQADDVKAPAVQAAVEDLEQEAAKQPDLFIGEATIEVSQDRTVASIAIPTAGSGSDATSKLALDALRGDIVPSTVGKVGGVDTGVLSYAAFTRDFNDSMISHAPIVFLFVIAAAFLLLLMTFRSIVIPLKAIALNLLSVGAAYGVLVLVFQNGLGEKLLGFESTGSVTGWLPMFLFVILFGLSMDYHVFILSRVREAFDRGKSTEEAVSEAIKSTAGTVTSAALVMVGVFSVFATLSSLDMKQMGIGLAAAVLIDATLVRAVLLPASMKLLGKWNWWMPKSLSWLPTIAPEKEVAPAAA